MRRNLWVAVFPARIGKNIGWPFFYYWMFAGKLLNRGLVYGFSNAILLASNFVVRSAADTDTAE